MVWSAAYTGAIVFFRIEQQIEPPFSYRINELQARFAEPDSPLRQRWQTLLHNFSPLVWWDSGHYRSIIERGYHYAPPRPGETQVDAQHNIAFFPLYPLLCKPLAPLIGVRPALVLVSNVCGLLACVLTFLWLRPRLGQPAALLATAVVFAWPAACFYSFGYSESTALLLIAAALLAIERQRWWLAAAACGLATAARPTAISLMLVLCLSLVFQFRAARVPLLPALLRLLAVAAVGLSGILAYAAYLALRFGSPLVYFANYQAGWNAPESRAAWNEFLSLQPVWRGLRPLRQTFSDLPTTLVNLTGPMTWNMPCTLAIVGLSLWGTLRGPSWLRPLAPLGALIFLHHYLSCGGADFSLESAGRYTAVALPALVMLGLLLSRAGAGVRIAVMSTLLLLQASWAFQFGMHEWAG